MKKTFKMLAIAVTLSLSLTGAAYAAPADVAGQSYEKAVTVLTEKGIITGDTDGYFHPDSNLTRAQACVIIVKTMNPPAAEVSATATQTVAKSGFSDMSGYSWAEGYIGYAVSHGVTKGYPGGVFKPGSKVTTNELITMILRAAGYSDESIGGTWPSNYVNKANEQGLLESLPYELPNYATKWMAAQLDYNALDKIEAANPPAEAPAQGTDEDKPDSIPNASAMTFGNGSFNSSITTFKGIALADNVEVYTFGLSQNFSSSMKFSQRLSDYREDTVYKYKSVKTNAFYKVENGKIVEMILPRDAGFTGRAYCVINNTISTINGSGESVSGIETLTAAREITWLGKKGLTGVPIKAQYLNGELYELNLSNGIVQSIYKSSDAGKKGRVFNELSSTGAIFVDVDSYKDSVVKITAADGGEMFRISDNSTVYILDAEDPTEYKAGSVGSIRSGVEIRAYDISDDDIVSADLIIIKR